MKSIAGLLYNITNSTLLWYWWYISMIVLSLYWYTLAIYLYFFIDFIALYYVSCFHAASSMPGIFIPAYILLCTFMMIHRHEHIYYIHLPMLSMLSSGTCFQLSIPFMAPMLLYFYMIHISLRPPALALVLSSIWEVYTFYSLGVCSTGAQCTLNKPGYILFIYLFSIIYDSLYKLYPSFYIKSGYFLSMFYLYSKNHQICTMNLS